MASMLRSIDESLGRLMATLDSEGLAANTIVIFHSDNGGNVHSNVPGNPKTQQQEKTRAEFFKDWRKWAGDKPPMNNAPLREGKGRMYEGGVRVPVMPLSQLVLFCLTVSLRSLQFARGASPTTDNFPCASVVGVDN
jgi:hypothetical protein